jgi:hypothetical protein
MTLAFPEPSGPSPDTIRSTRHSHHRHEPQQAPAVVAHETFDSILRARLTPHPDQFVGGLRQPAIICAKR